MLVSPNFPHDCCQGDRLCCVWNYPLFVLDKASAQKVGWFQAWFLWKLGFWHFPNPAQRAEGSAGCLSSTAGWKDAVVGVCRRFSECSLQMLSEVQRVRHLPLGSQTTKRLKSWLPGPSSGLWGLPVLTGEVGMLRQPQMLPAPSFLINYFRHFPIKVNLYFSCFNTVCSKTQHLNWTRTGFAKLALKANLTYAWPPASLILPVIKTFSKTLCFCV